MICVRKQMITFPQPPFKPTGILCLGVLQQLQFIMIHCSVTCQCRWNVTVISITKNCQEILIIYAVTIRILSSLWCPNPLHQWCIDGGDYLTCLCTSRVILDWEKIHLGEICILENNSSLTANTYTKKERSQTGLKSGLHFREWMKRQ